MEKLNACPVCKGTSFKLIHTCTDFVASGESFNIEECQECQLQFTNPRPDEKEIGRYYQSDKYISHAGSDKSELGVTYKLYDIIRNYSIGKKLDLIKEYHKSGNLLDLGCGLGYFLDGVKNDATFNALGADVSDEAITYVKKKFDIEVINEASLNQVAENSFDVITQWHVMEHVHQLEQRIKHLKHMLKPGGTMFIAVPISESWDAKYYKAFWDGYDVPRHLYHFSRKSFHHLMKKHGFRVEKEKGMWFDAPYISMRSEYHQKHSLGFFKGATIGTISNLNALFTGRFSSIMFIVKNEN